jgi:hypothetical protein
MNTPPVSQTLVVQMWLLSATLDAYLAGHSDAALPGAVISGVLFLACGGFYLFVNRLEKLRRLAGAADCSSSSLPSINNSWAELPTVASGPRKSLTSVPTNRLPE